MSCTYFCLSISNACNLASDNFAIYFLFRAITESVLILCSWKRWANSIRWRGNVPFQIRKISPQVLHIWRRQACLHPQPMSSSSFLFFKCSFCSCQAPDGPRPCSGLVLTVLCSGLPPTSTLLTRSAPPRRHPTDPS